VGATLAANRDRELLRNEALIEGAERKNRCAGAAAGCPQHPPSLLVGRLRAPAGGAGTAQNQPLRTTHGGNCTPVFRIDDLLHDGERVPGMNATAQCARRQDSMPGALRSSFARSPPAQKVISRRDIIVHRSVNQRRNRGLLNSQGRLPSRGGCSALHLRSAGRFHAARGNRAWARRSELWLWNGPEI
jgi:hypothetical protein